MTTSSSFCWRTKLNHEIANALMNEELIRLRKSSYEELLKFVKMPMNTCLYGPDGKKYQIESQAFWDSKKGGNIRAMVSVDDGGIRAFAPLTTSFARRSFVGENS